MCVSGLLLQVYNCLTVKEYVHLLLSTVGFILQPCPSPEAGQQHSSSHLFSLTHLLCSSSECKHKFYPLQHSQVCLCGSGLLLLLILMCKVGEANLSASLMIIKVSVHADTSGVSSVVKDPDMNPSFQ